MIINIHSMVDVITNSSTELFVADTKKSVEVVKEILNEAIDLHNSTHDTMYTFEDIFDDPYIGTPKDALDGREDYHKSRIKKGIIIRGAGDNSIPYWMFEFIESVFSYSTERFHLG